MVLMGSKHQNKFYRNTQGDFCRQRRAFLGMMVREASWLKIMKWGVD